MIINNRCCFNLLKACYCPVVKICKYFAQSVEYSIKCNVELYWHYMWLAMLRKYSC